MATYQLLFIPWPATLIVMLILRGQMITKSALSAISIFFIILPLCAQSAPNQPISQTSTTHSSSGGPSKFGPVNHLPLSTSAVVNLEIERPAIIQAGMQHSPDKNIPSVERRYGSGFFISKDGLIVTNAHVVHGASNVVVKNQDGNETLGQVIGADPLVDIAVIKTSVRPLNYISLNTSSSTNVGEPVYAIGSSFGLPQSVTCGIISALHRSISNPLQDFIQTDSAINQGNSGGPLINQQGDLIGVNTMIIGVSGGNNGVGFAIPTQIVRNIAEQIISYGNVSPGQVGVQIQNISSDMATALGQPDTQGVVVSDIIANSTAAKAGIQAKDIIIQLNDQPIVSSAQLAALVYSMRVGSDIKIDALRNGKKITLKTTILAPVDPSKIYSESPHVFSGLSFTEFKGVNTSGNRLEGLGVLEVVPGSQGWLAGLMPNDLITQIGSQKVRSLSDLEKIKPKDPTLVEIIRQNKPGFLVLSPPSDSQ